MSITVAAQQTVKGRALDYKGNPIDSVQVSSCKFKGTGGVSFTDSSGRFSLKVTGSRDLLVFQKEGLKDSIVHLSQISDLKEAITIQLMPLVSHKLQDVLVKSERPLLKRTLDRISMAISGSGLENIGTAIDLIKYGPGVAIVEDKILLNGHQMANILINGRRLNLSGRELQAYLNSLKSTDIKAIEFITQPPANYDAEGSGGLINILLKKNANEGLTGTISLGYSQGLGKFPDYNPSITLNYHKDKLSVNAELGHEYFKTFYDIETKRNLKEKQADYFSTSANARKVVLNSQRLGMIYALGKNQYIGIDYLHYIMNGNTSTRSNTDIDYGDTDIHEHAVGAFSNSFHKNFSDISGNYIYETDTAGSKISLLSDLSISADPSFSGSHSTFYSGKNLTGDTAFRYLYPGRLRIFTFQAEHKKVFNQSEQLTIGTKLSDSHMQDNNHAEELKESRWIKDPASAFTYKYKERIIAGFINFRGKTTAIEYQFGLRGEYTRVYGAVSHSADQDISHRSVYFDIFPTVYVKKGARKSSNNYWLFTYGRRIKRPSYFQLNPFRYFNDSYSTSNGNPYLHPQYTHSFELSYSFTSKYIFALNYSRTDKMISPITMYSKDSVLMNTIYENVGSTSNLNLSLTASLNITNWWTSNNTVIAGYGSTNGNDFKLSKAYLNANLSQDFHLSGSCFLNLFFNYRYNELWANTIYSPQWRLDFSARKKLLGDKLLLSLGINDLFWTYGRSKSVQVYKEQQTHIGRNYQSREVNLSVTYRFDMGKTFKLRNIQRSNAAETNRL